jgi:hypothetical protein
MWFFRCFYRHNQKPLPAVMLRLRKSLGKTVLLAMEEQNEVAVRFTDQGEAVFFAVKTGTIISHKKIASGTSQNC